MIYIGIVIFLAVVLAVGWIVISLLPGEVDGDKTPRGAFYVLLLFVVGGMLAAITFGSSIKTVGAGHVGLVYTFGDITGQREAGLQFIFPWQGFKVTTIQTQKIRPETTCNDGQVEQCLEAFSAETQDVFIIPTVNLSVSPDNIQQLFTEVGPDYIDKLVRPRLHQIFKDETVLFESVEIAPNREVIRARVRARLITELAPFSITVEDLLLDNVDFRQVFKDAIEDKQVAEQEAQKQIELIRAARAEADQVIERARGEAEANRVLAESLRENGNFILQFRAIEKLAPNVRIMLLDSNSGIIPILGESLFGSDPPPPLLGPQP